MTEQPVGFGNLIEHYVAGRDVTCPVCEYNLRDARSERCPECGLALRLELQRPMAATGWWLTAVSGIAVALVMSLVILIPLSAGIVTAIRTARAAQFLQSNLVNQTALTHWSAITVMTIATIVFATALAWLLIARRTMARWWWGWRVSLALLCACSPLVLLRIIVWTIEVL